MFFIWYLVSSREQYTHLSPCVLARVLKKLSENVLDNHFHSLSFPLTGSLVRDLDGPARFDTYPRIIVTM